MKCVIDVQTMHIVSMLVLASPKSFYLFESLPHYAYIVLHAVCTTLLSTFLHVNTLLEYLASIRVLYMAEV